MAIDISKELVFLSQHSEFGRYLSVALERLANGVNTVGDHAGVDPTGTLPPPPPVQNLTVKTNGNGLVHASIEDHNEIKKGLHYFIEYDTTPAFAKPIVKHLGVTRTTDPFLLPTKDDNGQPQVFFFRAYSQYPGGEPGQKVQFGGTNPTAVAPGGTSQMTLLPSTGSGTAQTSGEQGGRGFGDVMVRPATGPKRRSG
jgi:hypothetical protein